MIDKNSKNKPVAYFIGIGGIGTSALAQWFLAQNWAVAGSDLKNNEITKELKKSGIKVKIGHKMSNLPRKNLKMVIYSPAIPFNNPELKMARKLGIKPLSSPQVIGCLSEAYKTIAIAGAHGKSTTTALVGLILDRAGFMPNVIVGAKIKEFGNKNFKFNPLSRLLVVEADEYKKSFLSYLPDVLVITSIDREHLDIYKNIADIKNNFLALTNNLKSGGFLVLNKEDKNIASISSAFEEIAQKKKAKVIWFSSKETPLLSVRIQKNLKIKGNHNLENALAAYMVASRIFKIKNEDILKVFRRFKGIWRRMEFKGYFSGNRKILIYDDYAHHPTEIKATLYTLHKEYPCSKIICVFQPHQALRLRLLFNDFISSFKDADMLILLPTYKVSGRDRENKKFSSYKLAKRIKQKFPKQSVFYLGRIYQLKAKLTKLIGRYPKDKSVVVMMGAGDIFRYTPKLLSK